MRRTMMVVTGLGAVRKQTAITSSYQTSTSSSLTAGCWDFAAARHQVSAAFISQRAASSVFRATQMTFTTPPGSVPRSTSAKYRRYPNRYEDPRLYLFKNRTHSTLHTKKL